MDIRQFMKRKNNSDSRRVENTYRQKIENWGQPVQANGAERMKCFVNVH